MQELAAADTENLAGGGDTDQLRSCRGQPAGSLSVRVGESRIADDGRQRLLGAAVRRTPEHRRDVDGLRPDLVGEHVGADGGDGRR